ncbi:hypothetical protein KIN20_002403 [Parelaphostrongylus tenuis]|uniref:Vesicle transport protein n=1 Tax=Parelaphostrongylus tenuis TaxID=148309 RepID=A0AAD5QDI7_PARTN|nr:hypothetical protein KIN20_002403 [Parelaphostrongylus tenuis]
MSDDLCKGFRKARKQFECKMAGILTLRIVMTGDMFQTVHNTNFEDSRPDALNGHYSSTQNITTPAASSSSLTWETRLQCFVGCSLLSIISSICAGYLLVLTKVNGFCIMSSIGAILSMASTCFLMGPVDQCRKMFDKTRWLASFLYVGFIALAIVAGLILKNTPLALTCIGGQYVTMAWYASSYIPYARETVIRFCRSCC